MASPMPEKRVSKLTAKGLQERITRLKGNRKNTFGYLIRKMEEIDALMQDNENVDEVSLKMSNEFTSLYKELCDANEAVKALMDEEEIVQDQTQWYKPKTKELKHFVDEVGNWLQTTEQQAEEAALVDAEVKPTDSISMVSSKHSGGSRSQASLRGSVVSSTTSSARLKVEAERAALIIRVEALKQRQDIEMEEAMLKARKEDFDLKTALAEVNAKIEVLTIKDSAHNSPAGSKVKLTAYRKNESNGSEGSYRAVQSEWQAQQIRSRPDARHGTRLQNNPERVNRHQQLNATVNNQRTTGQHRAADMGDLFNVMQRQNEITELLVKQHKVSTLPSLNIPVFNGDPLEYSFFMKAFEHGIEERTDSNKDRLHFLEQFTTGRPKVLVRSCSHMHPDRGYTEAKKLLNKHFGNEYTIASAYIEKALNWPVIRSEDGEGLTEFAVFLTSCYNTVDSMDYVEEMDSPTNLKAVICKLPFKLREKWRGFACDTQERTGKRARFNDLVRFVDKQARIASHPLYGNIQDMTPRDNDKGKANKEHAPRPREKKHSFATDVEPIERPTEHGKKDEEAAKCTGGSGKQCLFCDKEGHGLSFCKLLIQKSHKEKLDFLKSKGLCFGCLSQGHLSKGCQRKHTCKICNLKHPTILHLKKEDRAPSTGGNENDNETDSNPSPTQEEEICGYTGAGETVCALSIVPVKVRCAASKRVVESYAFLDPGSTGTFCTEELMKVLNATGKKTNILLRTMGNEDTVSTQVVYGLEVSGLEDNHFLKLPQVFSQSEIPVKRENIPQQTDVDRWPYLKEVQLKQIDAGVGLLIGTNVPKALEPWKVINSRGEGPYAVKTALGWTINGPLMRGPTSEEDTEWPHLTVNRISVERLEELTQQQMKYDFPECQSAERLEMSGEDKQFMGSVSQSAELIDGHYSISLPLRNRDFKFPNNRATAVQRAEGLRRKFLRNQEFHREYTKFMNEIMEKGYAEEIPTTETSAGEDKTWYIPHHGVYHPTKHKLRVVYDCAATYRGTSLNSQLLQGPDMTSSLIGVLTRFRQEPTAFISDIEGMFHQVRVPAEDTDMLRFLWWPQGDLNQEPTEHRMLVHLFGATSSPSCASYALRKCAEDNEGVFSSEATNAIRRNFYVDDCLKSVGTEEQAVTLIQDLRALCATGGFKLAKWASNSRNVLASVHEDDRAKEVKELDLEKDRLPVERALGVLWCVESDTLKFRVIIQNKPLTRRGVLSMVSTIYDPLGILAPLILPVKHILQELCRSKYAWDDSMPEALAQQWQEWVTGLHHLASFEVERCVKPVDFGETTSAQLHHFADASEKGYGTVTYLVSKNRQNQTHSAFIIGKARVTPLKPVTIPRLELTAAAVAVRMDTMMRSELDMNLEESVFWSDSTSVIMYLRNETTRYRTFVANRITAIRDRSKVSQWRHVNTSANPADYASRGLTVEAFLEAKTWITGPDFVTKPESEWPEMPDSICQSLTGDPEVKETSVYALAAEESTNATSHFIHHYSSWYHLKRGVAWILKLKCTLKLLAQKRRGVKASLKDKKLDEENESREIEKQVGDYKASLRVLPLSVSDVAEAELALIRFSQGDSFSTEIVKLQEGRMVSKGSPLYRLSPVIQDGILRVGGRLNRSAMQEESKHPVILAKDSHITPLILRSVHEELGHSGRNHVLSKVRQKYWILRSHAAIRRTLSRCVTCRRQRGKTESQIMADLPRERLIPDEPPFTRVGVDYFGPFEIKRGRTIIKRYGVVFTCLVVRAIHIEMASSLDTDSCIHALRRFFARRGQVQSMHSDNGTNFVAAERELRGAVRALDHAKIQDTLMAKGITWHFNPPAASHFGGVWERQIRTIRKVLNSIVKQQTVDEEGLHTLLCEVEAIINSRPITRVSNDPNDLEAITPNHLLLMKAKTPLPPGLFEGTDLYARRRWRQVQYLADLFWRRWTKEYLPDLQERQKWSRPKRNLAENDVVLVVDESAPRNSWLMGRVIQTFEDSKGLVRQVKVKTNTNILLRPVTKLCLLLEGDV